VIRSTNKKTAFTFIELLINGPTEAIYFITGSSGVYKNLLQQLINVSPIVKAKLKKSISGLTDLGGKSTCLDPHPPHKFSFK